VQLTSDLVVSGRVDPRPVAVARIALGIALVSNALEASVLLQRVADGRIRVPVVDGLPAPTDLTVQLFTIAAVLAGVALATGFFAGPAALVATGLNVWSFLWDQQTYSNHRVLVMLLVLYLVFARSDAVWAVRRRRDAAATVPWWPQLLLMTQVSVCYLFAGLNKVNSTYLDGDSFGTWLRWPLPDFTYPLLAIGSVAGELFLAWAFWWRRTRWLAVAVGVVLHGSIVVGMAEQTVPLAIFGITCVSTYWLFFNRPASGGPVPRRADARRSSVALDRT
jgi:hypothetical protein